VPEAGSNERTRRIITHVTKSLILNDSRHFCRVRIAHLIDQKIPSNPAI
jgi:hypothetical protein